MEFPGIPRRYVVVYTCGHEVDSKHRADGNTTMTTANPPRDIVEMVTLKNGSEEIRSLVMVTMAVLGSLMREGKCVLVYELTMLCRDAAHKLWGDTRQELWSLKLIAIDIDGTPTVHESTRNIVLSAMTGDEADMSLGSPIAGAEI